VFGKSLIEQKSFKSGFKNRLRITDDNCGSDFQTDGAENRKVKTRMLWEFVLTNLI